MIAIALALGLPIAYLLMQGWLAEFSYQVSLGLIPFIMTGLILFIVAIISVSLLVLKIAHVNPVESLRCE